jgi:hypothetical protein
VIIEDDSFTLGMPTPIEMLRQHARLVEAECDQLRLELVRARENIGKLVAIHQDQAAQISRLTETNERLTWDLSAAHVENAALKNRQMKGPSPTWGSIPSKQGGE